MKRVFTFDREAHRYTLENGATVISITDVLQSEGFVDYSFLPPTDREYFLQRGRAVADACHLLNIDKLNRASLVETVDWYGVTRPGSAPFVRAFEKFCIDWKIEPLDSEVPFYHPGFDFCGCPDLLAKSKRGIIDVQLKAGAVEDWVALQTAAEELLARAGVGEFGKRCPYAIKARYGLALRADGTYLTPRLFDNSSDLDYFLAALSCAKWKRAHKGWRAQYEREEVKQDEIRSEEAVGIGSAGQ